MNVASPVCWGAILKPHRSPNAPRLINAKVKNLEAQQALKLLDEKSRELEYRRQQLRENFSEQKSLQIRELEEELNRQREQTIEQFPEVAELLETGSVAGASGSLSKSPTVGSGPAASSGGGFLGANKSRVSFANPCPGRISTAGRCTSSGS